MTRRPTRRRKHDRLTGGTDRREEIECDMALAPFDRAARASEEKWGIDRLPELVSPQTAAIWGRTMANLNAALEACNPADVVACVGSALRGLDVMDKEATTAGHKPASGRLFEFELEADKEGEPPFRFAVLEDDMEWRTVKNERPDLAVFSKREVALALRAYLRTPLLDEVKKHFPDAKVINIKNREPVDFEAGGDPIPF